MQTFTRYGATLALMIFLAGCDSAAGPVDAAAAPPAPPAPQVAVTTAVAETLPLHSELPGRVAAMRVAEVRPQVGGMIVRRLFDEGANVRAGQLLFEIDKASYAARHAQAGAELAIEKAALVNLRIIAERYARLLDSHTVTRQDHDLAQANYQQGLARVQAREAALRAAQIDLARTEVRAGIAGRIGYAAVSEGALVASGQEAPLARIQQLDPVYIDIAQSSRSLQRPAGARVTVTLEDGSAYAHAGVVKFADMQVDQQTGMVTLRAQVPNPKGVLVPGMYVRTRVEQGGRARVVMLPQQAVRHDDKDQASALVVGAGGKVELRTLALGGSHGGRWAVLSGLKEGERVIVEGAMKVAPGMAVSAVPWRAAVKG